MTPTLTVQRSGEGANKLRAGLILLSGERVLVGIPSAETARRPEGLIGPLKKGSQAGEPTNAELLYIHTFGSKIRNIPARPVLEPAIMAEDNKERIVAELVKAADADVAGEHAEAVEHLNRAGLLASNAAKRWFVDPRNGWPQNARRTIFAKLSKLTGKRQRKALSILASIGNTASGLLPAPGTNAALDAINTVLVDTGQMRRAITWIVEEGQGTGIGVYLEGETEATRYATESAQMRLGLDSEAEGAAGSLAEILSL